jgi:hypothetical protein
MESGNSFPKAASLELEPTDLISALASYAVDSNKIAIAIHEGTSRRERGIA